MSPAGIETIRVAARTEDLVKVFGNSKTEVTALDGVNVEFGSGQFTAIMGPSGSGKSTLLHCLGALDTPDHGRCILGDTDLSGLNEAKRTQVRRDRLGFVFQAFNLIPTMTARENIELPLRLAGRSPDPDWMRTVVDVCGIAERLDHRPAELSGGQQQRVAVARAMVGEPEIVLADEPTGNLDSRSGAQVLSLLRRGVDDNGMTVVMVTHDANAAAWADRVIFLADGNVVDGLHSPTAERVLDRLKQLEYSLTYQGDLS